MDVNQRDIVSKSRCKQWTAEEDELLIKNYGNIKTSDLLEQLGVPKHVLTRRVRKLGLKMTEEQKKKVTVVEDKWTHEDDEFLINNYGEMRTVDIANKLGVTKNVLMNRARKLGLKMSEEQARKMADRTKWTPEEDDFLIKNYGNIRTEDIAKRLGVTQPALMGRVKRLGLKMNQNQLKTVMGTHMWTPEDDEFLIENYGYIQTVKLAEKFDVSMQVIHKRVTKLGLKMTQEQMENLSGKRKWTPAEDSTLRKYYGKVDINSLAKKLGRTETAIRKRAIALKISQKRTPWTHESMEYIRENWGLVSISRMCKKFKLTENQVRNIARYLNLGVERRANDSVFTVRDVAELTGQSVCKVNYALKQGYLGFKYFKGKDRNYVQISYENFCDYLKDAKHCDLSNADIEDLKPYYCTYVKHIAGDIGIELDIDDIGLQDLRNRIKRDKERTKNKPENYRKDWTLSEEKRLRDLAETQKYTRRELSVLCKRSLHAINGKLREDLRHSS